jgi:uncharacterized protein (DUF1778 family)
VKQAATNVRFKPSDFALIKRAAKFEGRSMNTFVVRSSIQAAKLALAAREVTAPAPAPEKAEATA